MPDTTRSIDGPTRSFPEGGESTVREGTGGPMPPPSSPGRYELGDEIASGGMGVVYRATDRVLDREVAVKVLKDRHPADSAALRRFADEARITGQLQHPGIPPVHDLGTLPDGRPFLAMKLIRGDTLGHLLPARPEPPPAGSPDRVRFLAAFEQVCQAIAYAHSQGVIHRDLKPSNVMVGAFGEVQVMDWGLAKILASRERQRPESFPITPVADAPGSPGRDATQAGSVLGTPAYMPPEQAAGQIDRIDLRSDVFGLGGILCAILTGRPPFVGDTVHSTWQMAAAGKVDACFTRLDGCGADPELVALCKRCLAPERDDRPRDAGEVARVVAAHAAGVREQAERERTDRVRAAERRRRRVWVGLVAALAVASVGAVLAVPHAREWHAAWQLRRWTEWGDAHGALAYRMPDGKYMLRFNRRAVGEENEPAVRQAVTAVIDRAEKDGLTDRVGGIDLSGHGLTRVPPEVFCCRGLTTLYLNGNNLKDLPPDIGAFPELRTLDLSRNDLEALPAEFGSLTRLDVLDLGENRFRAIPPQVFRLTALTTLSLKRNEQLAEPGLSSEIGQLTELTTLDLARTNLKRLPPEIGRLGKLAKLHVPRNDLTELPPEIGDLRSLKALHVSNNKDLARLPPEIGKLSQLAELYASDCGLTHLPPEFGGLVGLTTTHLSGNRLSEIPPGVGTLRKLRTLDLRLNPMKELPAGVADALQAQGTTVQLGDREKKGGGKHRP